MPVCMEWNGLRVDTGIFNDILKIDNENAKVLARYASNYYGGKPALVEHVVGNGKVLHFGGTFTRDTVKMLLSYVGIMEPYEKYMEIPLECELCVRKKNEETYFFILNYSSQKQEIYLKQEMLDINSGKNVKGKNTLNEYEVRVYKVVGKI